MLRNRHLRFSILALAVVLLGLQLSCVSCVAKETPRNVILLIGDGMGPGQVLAAQLTRHGEAEKLHMQQLPVKTMIGTDNAVGKTTDSAAASTALSTGVKTTNGALGLDPEGRPLRTILQALRDEGMAVGLVTTTPITHATPAGFASHVKSRSMEPRIAEQLISSGTHVMMGGGLENFLPKSKEGSKRSDERNLLDEARARGYQVALTPQEFASLKDGRILALLQMGGLSTNRPEPSLAEMTERAIRALDATGKGFFLMVEGGQIDWECHANRLEGAIDQTLKFDDAVGKAMEFARRDGKTLVIVTADHETGGLTITPRGGKEFDAKWSTGSHTSAKVPLWAYGPGAEALAKAADNVDIPQTLARLYGVKIGHTTGLARLSPAVAAAGGE